MILLEYQNIKTYFQNAMLQKVQNTVRWTYLISDLEGKESFKTFYQK